MDIRRKRHIAGPIPTEHESQVAFFRRVSLHPMTRALPIFAIPNGGHRHKAVAAKLKAEGVKAGVPDICVAVQRGVWFALFIEMKRPKKKPTPAQLAWHGNLVTFGYRVEVCEGAEHAWQTLCDYMYIPEESR